MVKFGPRENQQSYFQLEELKANAKSIAIKPRSFARVAKRVLKRSRTLD